MAYSKYIGSNSYKWALPWEEAYNKETEHDMLENKIKGYSEFVEAYKKAYDKSNGKITFNYGYSHIGPQFSIEVNEKRVLKKIIDGNSASYGKVEKDDESIMHRSNTSIVPACTGLATIKGYEKSSFFGYKRLKKEMYDECNNPENPCKFAINELFIGEESAKDGNRYDTITINYNGKSYKFMLSEVEITFPTKELIALSKGFNPVKDRTIKKGSMVRLVKTKNTTIPHKAKVKVHDIHKIGSKVFATVIHEDKQRQVLMKNLKVI